MSKTRVGVIENKDEFNEYLVSNGYADKIHTGNFIIKKGSDYKEIADMIAK